MDQRLEVEKRWREEAETALINERAHRQRAEEELEQLRRRVQELEKLMSAAAPSLAVGTGASSPPEAHGRSPAPLNPPVWAGAEVEAQDRDEQAEAAEMAEKNLRQGRQRRQRWQRGIFGREGKDGREESSAEAAEMAEKAEEESSAAKMAEVPQLTKEEMEKLDAMTEAELDQLILSSDERRRVFSIPQSHTRFRSSSPEAARKARPRRRPQRRQKRIRSTSRSLSNASTSPSAQRHTQNEGGIRDEEEDSTRQQRGPKRKRSTSRSNSSTSPSVQRHAREEAARRQVLHEKMRQRAQEEEAKTRQRVQQQMFTEEDKTRQRAQNQTRYIMAGFNYFRHIPEDRSTVGPYLGHWSPRVRW
jgi:hypothetical protein